MNRPSPTHLRLLILAILLLVAGANSALNLRQFFFSGKPYTGMKVVRDLGGMTVQEVFIRDNLDRPSPAFTAGILPGDRIDTIEDQEGRGGRITGIFDFADRIRMFEPGRTYSIQVFRPTGNGPPQHLFLSITPREKQSIPISFRDLISALGIFVWVPLAMILAGSLVGFLRPGDKNAFLAGILFFAFAAVFNVNLVSFPPFWRELLLFYRKIIPGLAPFLFLLFFLRYPFPSPMEKKAPWLKYAAFWILFLPQAYHAAMDIPAYFSFEWELHLIQATAGRAWAGFLNRLYFPAACALYFLGIVSLALNEEKAQTARDRRRLALIGGGSAGLVSLFILDLLTRLGVQAPTWLKLATSALVGLFPLSFVYAVIKHRVFGIRFMVRRGLQYALISRGFLALEALLIFTALFFLAGPLIAGLFPRAGQSFASVGTAAITLVLVAGLRWINCRVMPVIDRWFFRDAYDARLILTELSHSIRRSPSRPDLLLNTVSDRIQRTLHPRWLTIFLREDDWSDLEPEDGLAEVALPVRRSDGEELYRPFIHRREGGRDPAGIDSTPFRLEAVIPETDGLGLLLDRAAGGEPESAMLTRDSSLLIIPLVTGGDVIGFMVLAEKRSEEPYSREDRELLLTVAEQIAIALDHGRLAAQLTQQEMLQRELEIAQEVQARLFPQKAPELKTLELAGDCIQAREVGGDYYDFIEFGKGWVGLVLADIAGKGISAALLMASLQASLRSQQSVAVENLQKLAMLVNRQFNQTSAANRFATLFFGIYHDDNRLLRYVNCGHQAALILRPDGTTERLPATGTVLGAFQEWEGSVAGVKLKPEDLFLLFSDGITEAVNREGEEFGESRLIDIARKHRHLPASQILDKVIDRVGEFSGRVQRDDLTLMIARAR